MSTSTNTATLTVDNTQLSVGFQSITSGGSVTATAIDPQTAGSVPGAFTLNSGSIAVDIDTTATFSGAIIVRLTICHDHSRAPANLSRFAERGDGNQAI